jgi:hypothetical protein
MGQGESYLQSVTELQALNGANTAIVGREVIRFVNVSGPDANGIYTLDTLLRGRRGTGQQAEVGHARGERFVLMSATWTGIVSVPLTDLYSARFYRAITLNSPIDDAGVYPLVWQGTCLRPYFVAHLEGTRDGSNNVDLTWVRRSRVSGDIDWNDQQGDIPLGETEEAYETYFYEEYIWPQQSTDAGSLTTTIRDIGGFTAYTEDDLVGRPISIQHQDDYLTEEYSVITGKQDNNVIFVDPPWRTAPANATPYAVMNTVIDQTEYDTTETSRYAVGDQTNPGSVIYAIVCQMSSAVGRGFGRAVWVW